MLIYGNVQAWLYNAAIGVFSIIPVIIYAHCIKRQATSIGFCKTAVSVFIIGSAIDCSYQSKNILTAIAE